MCVVHFFHFLGVLALSISAWISSLVAALAITMPSRDESPELARVAAIVSAVVAGLGPLGS